MARKSKQKWTLILDGGRRETAFSRSSAHILGRPDATLTRWSANGKPEIDVVLEWKMIEGRAEVVMIQVMTPDFRTPLTAADLRSIPFSIIENQERSRKSGESMESTIERSFSSLETTRGAHSGKPLTHGDLQLAADLYREAHQAGSAIHPYIAQCLGVSESTAGKRIVAARRAGLLGAALGTRAGEDTDETRTKKHRKKLEK